MFVQQHDPTEEQLHSEHHGKLRKHFKSDRKLQMLLMWTKKGAFNVCQCVLYCFASCRICQHALLWFFSVSRCSGSEHAQISSRCEEVTTKSNIQLQQHPIITPLSLVYSAKLIKSILTSRKTKWRWRRSSRTSSSSSSTRCLLASSYVHQCFNFKTRKVKKH